MPERAAKSRMYMRPRVARATEHAAALFYQVAEVDRTGEDLMHHLDCSIIMVVLKQFYRSYSESGFKFSIMIESRSTSQNLDLTSRILCS